MQIPVGSLEKPLPSLQGHCRITFAFVGYINSSASPLILLCKMCLLCSRGAEKTPPSLPLMEKKSNKGTMLWLISMATLNWWCEWRKMLRTFCNNCARQAYIQWSEESWERHGFSTTGLHLPKQRNWVCCLWNTLSRFYFLSFPLELTTRGR